jgi:hypothetical protein
MLIVFKMVYGSVNGRTGDFGAPSGDVGTAAALVRPVGLPCLAATRPSAAKVGVIVLMPIHAEIMRVFQTMVVLPAVESTTADDAT